MSTNLRILIIEDSEEEALLLLTHLRQGGIEPEHQIVETLEQLKAALDGQGWDVVLSDYRMQGFNGLDALELVRRKDPYLPFILISGSIGEELAIEAMRRGINDYLIKGSLTRLVPAVMRTVHDAAELRARDQAEEALRESEAKFSKAFRTSPYAITITRIADGKFVDVNEGFVTITGFTREEALGDSSIGLKMWVNAEDRRRVVSDLGAGQAVVGQEFLFRRKSGEVITGLFSAQTIQLGPASCVLSSIGDITGRKKAEEALRTLSLRQQTMLAAIPDIVVEVDKNKVHTWMNPAGLEFYGEDAIGKEASFYFEGEQDTYGAVEPLFAGGEGTIYVESWQRRRDGAKRLLAWWCRMLRDGGGNIIGALSTARDITDHKLAHRELQLKNLLLATQQEASIDGILVVDEHGRILSFNKRFLELWGVPPGIVEAGADERLLQFVRHQTKDPEAFYSRVQYLYAHKDEKSRDELRLKDGRVFDRYSAPMLGEGGAYFGRVWYFRDITKNKQAEEAIKSAMQFQQVLMDAIPSPVFYKDARLVYLGGNKAFERYIGLPPEQFIGKTVYDISPADLAGKYDRADRELLDNPGSQSYEASVVYADGIRRDVIFYKATFSGADGKVAGMIGVIVDITDRKQAEATLANMQKLESLGTLAGGIAHDFNNILTAILGNLSLLRSHLKGGEGDLELLIEAQNACNTAKGLSHQLLTFAKGGAPIVRVMDLRALLSQASGFAVRGSSARCLFDLGETPLTVNIDKEQISQVIQNLVINAVQAMPAGGDITVKADIVSVSATEILPLAAGRYVRVTVGDQGTGIPQAQLSRIFDPYFSTKAAGRGLGLAVCHSVMAKHGGNIKAGSRPGAGSVFTLHFPAADSADIPLEQGSPVALAPGSGRVLIMDDDVPIAKVLKRMLSSLGYQAESVEDGKAALDACLKARAAGKPYDLVIMDLTIPGGMGGKETMAKLRVLDPKAKAIVSSGYGNDPVMSEYAAHGFSGVLTKPYSLEEVSEALRRVIGEARGG